MEEDTALRVHRDEQTKEFVISGAGQLHVEVAVERLKRKFGVEVELKAPKVPYKETIKGSAKAQGKHKRQTGGHGQYGDCWIELSPLPRGAGLRVRGRHRRRRRSRASSSRRSRRASASCCRRASSPAIPIVDVKVRLYDGSAHDVDSSEMAFKIAASLGFKKAFEECRPVLLEPIVTLTVTVPDEFMGDIIGDLNSRRGKVLGAEPKGNGQQVIRAHVPMAEVLRYAPDLRSMTQGRGDFEMELAHYEEVPPATSPSASSRKRRRRGPRSTAERRRRCLPPRCEVTAGEWRCRTACSAGCIRSGRASQPALRRAVYGGRPSWTREPNTLPWFDQPDALERIHGDDAALLRSWVERRLRRGRRGRRPGRHRRHGGDARRPVGQRDARAPPGAARPARRPGCARRATCRTPSSSQWEPERRARVRAASDWRIHGFHYVNPPARAASSTAPASRALASRLFGRRARPFAAINFMKGSRQHLHQDMGVFHIYPHNYLIGAWIACEDVAPDSGPLVIHPGSHRAPFFPGFADYPQTNLRTADDALAQAYEAYVERGGGAIPARGVPRAQGPGAASGTACSCTAARRSSGRGRRASRWCSTTPFAAPIGRRRSAGPCAGSAAAAARSER